MKILQVISSFAPAYAYGGPVRVAYEISKKLVERGHEVTVYTTDVYDAHSRFKYDENPMWIDGIEVYHFRNISNKLAHNNLAIAPSMAILLSKNIKNFDIVPLHEYRSFQAVLVHHYAKKYGIPYVLQAHGSVLPFFQKQGLKKIFDLFLGYKILKDASKAIALTKTETEQYKKMGVDEDKIEIVPNGIDLSEFENLPQRGEFRKKWGINDNQQIILYLGRIHQTKGLDLLARAFAGLSKDFNEAKLVITGPDDGYLTALKKLIKELDIEEKVLLTGMLYERDKPEAYVDADVFVNPRPVEIFGIVFLEALACGTPVICSAGCGIADVIDGQVGLVVPYDKDQLSNAILHMLNDDKMRLEFSEKGKLLVRERFNWEKIAGQVERVYEMCL